jgi:hypothetical protein
MFQFRSKIDPFSAFTINLGPLYVERVFDSLLTREGIVGMVQINSAERFTLYIEYLKTNTKARNHTQYAVTQFYKGYFFQRLADHSTDSETARHYQEKALCHYQNYLDLADREDESLFYAQWQMGELLDVLNYTWSLVEENLQMAATTDSLRGEPMKKIVGHFIATREWKKAYPHSKTATDKYFDKNPVAYRRWYVDFDAYNWSVLSRHRAICLNLGRVREAEEANTRKKILTA